MRIFYIQAYYLKIDILRNLMNLLESNSEKFTALVNAKPKFVIKEDVKGSTYTITRITPTKQTSFTFQDKATVTSDPLGADLPQLVILQKTEIVKESNPNITNYNKMLITKSFWTLN